MEALTSMQAACGETGGACGVAEREAWCSNETGLSWSGGSAGLIFECNSHCKAWFRGFYVNGGGFLGQRL